MHRCAKCKREYQDNEVPVITGCPPPCGSKFFIYYKEGEKEKVEQLMDKVTIAELNDIERKIETQKEGPAPAPAPEKPSPVRVPSKPSLARPHFGVETVKEVKPGVYKINVEALLKGKPVVIKQKGEIYVIHLASVFTGKAA